MNSLKPLAVLLALLLAFNGCDLGGPADKDPDVIGGGGTEVDGIWGTVVDQQGKPVANARVQVFPEATSGLAKGVAGYAAINDSARTDAKGEYLVDSLPAGTYALLARTVRNDSVLTVLVRSIVHDGGRRNLGIITLEAAGKISIKVESEGEPVFDAQCAIAGLDDFKALTSANGTCVLSGLPAGRYRVTITHALFGTAETGTIVVKAGTTASGGQVELVREPGPGADTALVAHWNFEDNTGNVLRDVAGGHNGTFVGTANLQPDGVSGNSLHFDGSNYARVPASPEFSRLSSFTLSAWVWQSVQNMDEPVMEFSHPDTLGVHVWLNTRGTDTVSPGTVYSNTVPLTQGIDPSVFFYGRALAAVGRWNHVAYTYDAATREIRLYLNGVQIGSSTLPVGRPAKAGDFYLGYRPLDSRVGRKGATLRGRLDEVKIWSRVLSTSDLAAEASQGDGSEVTLLSSGDTYVNRSSTGSGVHEGNNFGAGEGLLVGVYDLSTIPTGLLQFELPSGVSSARIAKAVVRVHSFGWTIKNVHPANVTVKLHKVLRPWKEGKGVGVANSAAVDGVTALERFWGTQNGSEDWNTASIGFDDVDVSAASINVTRANGYNGAWEFDVTAQAKAWADTAAQNFGVLLRVDVPATNELVEDYPAFHSRESAVADGLKPQLVLTLD